MIRISRNLRATTAKRLYSTGAPYVPVKTVQYDVNKGAKGFNANEPTIFKKSFLDLPATEKWFTRDNTAGGSLQLNESYLERFADSTVPLELTRIASDNSTSFERFEAPLSLLIVNMTGPDTPSTRLYLAQHSLVDLPAVLQEDLPTPKVLTQLGRGDIYASSLWMGRPPTRTPLHRDPNPNLFVQIAGSKVIRLLEPNVGRGVYERVRASVGNAGGRASMRGEEMMQGKEMEAMEKAVWEDEDDNTNAGGYSHGFEAQLESGDGLYIPLGWWHAVRSVGMGANASVSFKQS